MSKDERRINKRLDTKFKISYVHEHDYLISFTKNISADGMFVETENPPAVGSTIKLIFSIGNLKKIEINAEVMWVNKGPLSKDHGMGLKFLNMPAKDKDAILKEINIVAVL
ncbi:response regulator receiver [hydrocarbon metagenome]|uniref:Response regulator receiver n=1 Tax=hydrocarbon metagenome TaxID=938273 RepID=A0A0W8FNB3_9ZZZZ